MKNTQSSASIVGDHTGIPTAQFIHGKGEMPDLVRTFDWNKTTLGPLASWSSSFLDIVNTVLASPIPTAIYWGSESLLIYNDGYRPFAGVRHPASLGAPASSVWQEAWHILAPQVAAVLGGGEPTYHENLLVPLLVDGQLQDFYWTYSFSPSYEDGRIGGVFNVCQSTTHSMLAERKLRESETRALRVLESIGDAVIVTDADGLITRMNPVAEELTGWSIQEAGGHTLAEVFHIVDENSRKDLEDPADKVKRLETVVWLEDHTVMHRRDGTEIHVDDSAAPIRNEAGELIGMVLVFRNVEARRQMEQERASARDREHDIRVKQELLLKLLQEQRETTDPAVMMLAAAEAVGRHLGAERTGFFDVVGDFNHLTVGWTSGELPPISGTVPLTSLGDGYVAEARSGKARGVRDYATDPSTRDAVFGEIGVRSGIGVPVIRHGRWQSGFYVHCTRVRDWTEAEVNFACEVANQTLESVELALSQQAVRRSEERARKILESIGDAVIVTDSEARITGMNPIAEKLTGWTVLEARGVALTDVFRLLDGDDGEGLERAATVMAKLKLMSETRGQAILACRDGKRCHIDHSATQMREDHGPISGMVLIFRDITERSTTERRLRQAYKMEALGQLTGGIAHDFNNILAIIMGNLELIAEGLDNDPVSRERIEQTVASAERAADLTRRLLAYARQQPLDTVVVDIVNLVNAAAEFIRRSLGPTITLQVSIPDALWSAKIDRNQFENALLNLAVNARDAMPSGGKLHIECSNCVVGPSPETLGELTPGQYLLITVTDTGQGMSSEALARATEPFYTTKPIGKGTGLGLSMVYGFLKQSGGHMRIESELGAGTKVLLYLPRALSAEIQPSGGRVRRVAEALPRGKELVLIVEDELAIRRTIAYLLNSLGYKVLEAEDGPSAMAYLQSDARIDLLLTDVILPNGISGPALAKQSKALQPGMKVIFSSGYTSNVLTRDFSLEEGVHLLNKPFHLAELAKMARNVLDLTKDTDIS